MECSSHVFYPFYRQIESQIIYLEGIQRTRNLKKKYGGDSCYRLCVERKTESTKHEGNHSGARVRAN